jgi:FtsP/CotA-like multicopper oxidase with cupredoxin domain
MSQKDEKRHSPQPDEATPKPNPTLSRRDLLKVGTIGTVGLAAATGALAIPALRELRAQDSALRFQGAPDAKPGQIPEHGSHHQLNAVGEINLDAFDPTAFLTRFDTGRLSRLPSGQPLREYDIVAEDREIEIAPGLFFPAWTYNGQVPGPTLRCTEGDRIRVRFTNEGSHPHTIHFHGIHPANMDGAFETVMPGSSYTYDFDAEPFGVQLYHCHTVPLKRHIHKGLYGMLIIDPKGGRPPAREMVMVMNAFDTNFDGENEVYAVNTVAFHYQKHAIPIQVGELVRIYLSNITEFDLINSFHLHGNFFRLYRTGSDLERFEWTDVVTMGQGERAVLEFTYKYPGPFMFHAHQSEFAELGWTGMFNVRPANG